MAYPKGNFDYSPPPSVLETITDANLDTALEVVAAVGAAVKPVLSGAAENRLLAWLVADARGATKVLDPPSAETVGKRLRKQALKVRADLAAVPQWAEGERARAHAAAEADTALRPQLRAELSAIDEAEQQKLKAPQEEIYVGFHELDQLELHAAPADDGPDDSASLRCPWMINPLPLPPPPPIPPDLSELLGEDGCLALREASEHCGPSIRRADDWWLALPTVVRDLQCQLSRQAYEHKWELHDANVGAEIAMARERKRAAERAEGQIGLARADEALALARVASLEEEVARARGREEALYEVIARIKGLRGEADTSQAH